MPTKIDLLRLITTSLTAFLVPVATSLIQGHNITTALHLGFGIALAHGIGFTQEPGKKNNL